MGRVDSLCTTPEQRDEYRVSSMPVRPQLGGAGTGGTQIRDVRQDRGRVENLNVAHGTYDVGYDIVSLGGKGRASDVADHAAGTAGRDGGSQQAALRFREGGQVGL